MIMSQRETLTTYLGVSTLKYAIIILILIAILLMRV